MPVELGAEFIHGRSPEIWQAVETGELEVVEVGGEARSVGDGPNGDDPLAPLMAALEAQRSFGEPVEETHYFAGEASNAEGHAGTVHGAMATGMRAARQVLHAMGAPAE